MERINITNLKFEDICQLTKSEYYWVDANTLIKQCEYLKNKRVLENTTRIDNPLGRFLFLTMERTLYNADYTKATKEFLQSDYFSSIMKKYIYGLLNYFNIQGDFMAALSSEIPFNDFTFEQLRMIKMELDKLFMTTRFADEIYNNVYDMYNDYMFVLDGEGPKEYIKFTYGRTLGVELLKHSGLNNVPSKYAGNRVQRYFLSEYHLMSLYKKFDKYLPDKKEELVKLIKAIDRLSAPNFISYYNRFVSHNFTTDFLATENIMPKEPEPPFETGDGKLSAEALEIDKYHEELAHNIILKKFIAEVVQYEIDKQEIPHKGK